MANNQTELARTDEEDRYVLMDKLDESQIIKEMEGKVISEYFYEFTERGIKKVGLSFAGVKYMANVMRNENNPLSIIYSNIEESPDGKAWLGNAVCENLSSHEKRAGHFLQPKTRTSGDENPFAYTLAGSKAERNAMRHFMPESAIVKAKEAWEKLNGKAATRDITSEAKVVDVSGARKAKCRDCGNDIVFVKVGEKTVPKNPDGSPHVEPPKP